MGLTAGRNSHKTVKKTSPLAVKIDQFNCQLKKNLTLKIFLLKAMEKNEMAKNDKANDSVKL